MLEWQRYRNPDFLYARAFRKTAAATLAALPSDASALDAAPAILLYRTALELRLKALILENGPDLLAAPPDRFSIFKSRSVSWLSQVVSRMLKAAGWDDKLDPIGGLDGFKALAEEWNSAGLENAGVRLPVDTQNGIGRLRDFTARTETLLDILDRFALVLEGSSVVAINRARRR